MKNKESWQVEAGSAKFYEQHFVPALFAQWAPRTVRAAHVKPGNHVLDAACGTGLVARFAANQTEPDGSVTGYDLNPGMLAVAATIAPQLEWVLGPVEKMPFQPESFDAVTCQFGLMFFQDQAAALREMYRVLRPGGTIALAVFDSIDHTPGYASLANLLEKNFGKEVANVLRAPFSLGDTHAIKEIFREANLPEPTVQTLDGYVKFPSVKEWIDCEINASPMKKMIAVTQLNTLETQAEKELKAFTSPDGRVNFKAPAHLVTVIKH